MEELEQHGFVVGVDVTDSYVTAAVVDATGEICSSAVSRRIDHTQPAEVLIGSAFVPCIEAAVALATGPVRAVGLSLPGTLRPEEGLCLMSTDLGWEHVPVRDLIHPHLGLPVVIVNDVRARIIGEMQYGAGIGVDNFVSVALGTTIDGGIVIDGRLYEGASDSAGEIGHITVDHEGLNCTCGNQGCLETLANGPAVARMAAESLQLGAQSVLTDWVSDETPVTAELVARAAVEGDALAIKVWEKVGRYLGLGLSAVITVVNPRRIILGGKVAQAFDLFAPTMHEEVRRRARMVSRDYTEIVASPLGLQAPLLGAAWTATQASAFAVLAGPVKE